MIPRSLQFILAFLLTMGCALAQTDGLTLTMENEGEYIYWLTYPDPSGFPQSTEPTEFSGKTTKVDIAPLGGRLKGATVLVLDTGSGNVAQKELPPDGRGAIAINKADFNLVRRVRIHIRTADGKDIRYAKVDLSDPRGWSATRVLDPANQGIAEFMYVPSGTSGLKVMYRDARGRQMVSQSLDVPLERASKDFEVTLTVSGSTGTLSAPAAQTSENASTANMPALPVLSNVPTGSAALTPLQPTSPAGGTGLALIGTVIGLMVLVGGVAFALKRLKDRGETVESVLSKVGVELPKESAPVAPPPGEKPSEPVKQDEGICEFCGMRKDPATGACACTVVETIRPSPSPGGAPRLIGAQGTLFGQIFPLQPGTTTIGRDETNTLTMPDPTVSRRHAQISVQNGSYLIRDLGSSNGTFVNGMRVTEHTLRPGDEVQIGGTKFRFEIA